MKIIEKRNMSLALDMAYKQLALLNTANNLCITGTVALKAYGINNHRPSEDIDIIVGNPTDVQKAILKTLEESNELSNYGDADNIKVKANAYTLNIFIVNRELITSEKNAILLNQFDYDKVKNGEPLENIKDKLYLSSPESILNAKNSYAYTIGEAVMCRKKDYKDFLELSRLYVKLKEADIGFNVGEEAEEDGINNFPDPFV